MARSTSYKWARGSHKVSAEAAAREVERVRLKYGEVRPSLLVEEARPVDSILHSEFNWDDTKAADLYRRVQARLLIQSIEVVIVSRGEETTTRALVSVKASESSPRKSFQEVEAVLGSPFMRDQMLQSALLELSRFRKKYAKLRKLSSVFAAIDRVLPLLEEKRAAAL